MYQTRRKFLKDSAVAGAVIAAGTSVSIQELDAVEKVDTVNNVKCPFFDQPMMCDGPDECGRYKCDKES